MQADARIGGARPAGHETHARPAAELALRFGHEGRAALLTAGDETDLVAVFVKAVERREITLTGHAEHGRDALLDQRLDEHVTGEAGGGGLAHGSTTKLKTAVCLELQADRAGAVQGSR